MIIITLENIKRRIQNGAIAVDVRAKLEYDIKHIDGAINIKYDTILSSIKKYTSDKNKEIILYCSTGARSKIAYNLLTSFGYTNVIDAGKINL